MTRKNANVYALTAALAAGLSLLVACDGGSDGGKVAVPGQAGALKSSASVRAARRAFDGAPPTIPHPNFNIGCVACHTQTGIEIPPYGFAPPAPHGKTDGLSAISRCNQCHVFKAADDVFVASDFKGLPQDLRAGRRLNDQAPPVIPHMVLMRENCVACHTGPAAREQIRCDHADRLRCTQCHVEQVSKTEFARGASQNP